MISFLPFLLLLSSSGGHFLWRGNELLSDFLDIVLSDFTVTFVVPFKHGSFSMFATLVYRSTCIVVTVRRVLFFCVEVYIKLGPILKIGHCCLG